jgi:phosphatidylglycerol---prolipoprotein diacylglyceryl transferase
MVDGIVIFGFKIYFYGILIMLGALAATWLAARRAQEYGQDPEMAWDILPWALIGGIVGARIWHILTPPASMVEQGITTAYYLTHPIEMLKIRNGGLGIPGAVIGGFLAVLIYTRRREISILTWADIIAPGLALAQGIGRWGNFFNQELYGAPTNLPWKLYIEPLRRLPEYTSVEYYHPLFLYESIWNLLNAGLLIYLSRRLRGWLKNGDLFFIYLVFYALGRFSLEFLRLDPSPVAGINANQTLMVVVGLGSALALFLRHRFSHAVAEPVHVAAADQPNAALPASLNDTKSSDDSEDGSPEEEEPASSNE